MSEKYQHRHRCIGCGFVWTCFLEQCIGAGSIPPPEGYLDECVLCRDDGPSASELYRSFEK